MICIGFPLCFFSNLSAYVNELNVKLQGLGKQIDIMFNVITALDSEFRVYQCDLNHFTLKYFPQ